ncbi:MAG: hypothetical protein EVB11_10125 [Winogradskyella sp.]|nr:MAG: hypothetical protein EVB11_10125 [Winogradskyella sp.]
MKKVFILFIPLLFISLLSQAQGRDFDGIWSGEISLSNGSTNKITLYIVDNNVYSVTTDEDGDRVKDRQKEVALSKGFGEQLNYVWMNKGGVWTETQGYSMAWINSNKISVYFFRHVSNKDDDSSDDNSDWGYTGNGFLIKE